MKPGIDYPPWFLPTFLALWAATMTYVSMFLFTVIRIRTLTGEKPNDFLGVFFDPNTKKYLGWFFSAEHRALGDPLVSRLTIIIRVMLFSLAPLFLLFLAAAILIH